MNCEKVFEYLVKETEKYIVGNNLKSMVLGISGGIDSTVCAAICHKVSENTGIPLIGRSIPIKNKSDEFSVSTMVGEVLCDDFEIVALHNPYETMLSEIRCFEKVEKQTAIANGNIQARLRMIYLYNLAGVNNGIVIDTDNLSEHYLGFYTIHGDSGDLNPIGSLWKTEVYELANYLKDYYHKMCDMMIDEDIRLSHTYQKAAIAIEKSIALTPTDGLGISSSDLEQIGADNYNQVDDILEMIVYTPNADKQDAINELSKKYPKSIVMNVYDRYVRTSFKRKHLPIKVLIDGTHAELGTKSSILPYKYGMYDVDGQKTKNRDNGGR